MGENGKIQLAWAPLMTATVAVPPLVACPLGGGEELEPPQPAATIAAPATTATPARRRVRLPRYIYAPLSWRTGAPLRAHRSCVQIPRRPQPGLPSRGDAVCRHPAWATPTIPDVAGSAMARRPLCHHRTGTAAGHDRAATRQQRLLSPTDRSERRWDLLTVRRRNRYDSSSISGGNGPPSGKSLGSRASDLVSRCQKAVADRPSNCDTGPHTRRRRHLVLTAGRTRRP